MLYSQRLERTNRFLSAIKITIPFLALILISFVYFKDKILSDAEILLVFAFIFIYIYYVVYQIYISFNISLVDKITGSFNRKTMIKIIKKHYKKGDLYNVAMLQILNINDINNRYGVAYGDKILANFTKSFQEFLIKNGFKNVPIGRYSGGYFLTILKKPQSELRHIIKTYERFLSNEGINSTEIKMKFALINANYDKNPDIILQNLSEQFQVDSLKKDSIKPDVYDKLVEEAIKQKKIFFKFQPISNLQKKYKILEAMPIIDIKEAKNLSKLKAINIASRIGYEVKFDEIVLEKLFEEINKNYIKDIKFLINISAVSLRNIKFLSNLKYLLELYSIKPENLIIEIREDNVYKEMRRFEEILNEYKILGLSFALQRFGGYNSSFEYVKTLPISYINFDMDFTKYIKKEKYYKLTKAYIYLAKELKIKSIVKFIDKDEVKELISELKPDFIQGFIVSKPKELERLKEEIKSKGENFDKSEFS